MVDDPLLPNALNDQIEKRLGKVCAFTVKGRLILSQSPCQLAEAIPERGVTKLRSAADEEPSPC